MGHFSCRLAQSSHNRTQGRSLRQQGTPAISGNWPHCEVLGSGHSGGPLPGRRYQKPSPRYRLSRNTAGRHHRARVPTERETRFRGSVTTSGDRCPTLPGAWGLPIQMHLPSDGADSADGVGEGSAPVGLGAVQYVVVAALPMLFNQRSPSRCNRCSVISGSPSITKPVMSSDMPREYYRP